MHLSIIYNEIRTVDELAVSDNKFFIIYSMLNLRRYDKRNVIAIIPLLRICICDQQGI